MKGLHHCILPSIILTLLSILPTTQCFTHITPSLIPTIHHHHHHYAAARIEEPYTISTKQVQTEDEIMDVASFRNKMTSPDMMILKQQSKRERIDPTRDAIKGVVIGIIVGIIAGGVVYVDQGDMMTSIEKGGAVGTLISAILAINNFQGKGVYVMSIEEARNRLIVDYAEMLYKKFDVGFATYVEGDIYNIVRGRYKATNGLVGCVDCQLRNSKDSMNTMTYGTLPSHVHIRNVEVDRKMRRKGVGSMLVKAVEEYAMGETDAELITLIVDDSNDAAIALYKKLGYDDPISIGSPTAQNKYGSWTAGRSIMTKTITK